MADKFDFLVSFGGETGKGITPINNIYVVSDQGNTKNQSYLPTSTTYTELRGMTYGPDGDFYVAQAYKNSSAILQFSGVGSSTLTYVGQFVTPTNSGGFLHPYQPKFSNGPNGNLYVSSQDTNVVSAFYGPMSSSPAAGTAMPLPGYLTTNNPNGTFFPGTIVPAYQAEKGIPPNTSVPPSQGGLSFVVDDSSKSAGAAADSKDSKGKTHSVRGITFDGPGNLYVADEGNNRVAIFSPDGAYINAITTSKNHALSRPVGLYFDFSTKLLYIGSPGNGRLYSYDTTNVNKDYTANSLVQDSDLDSVSGIIMGPDKNLYTGDRKSMKIHKWSSDFKSHSTFASFTDTPEQIILAAAGS